MCASPTSKTGVLRVVVCSFGVICKMFLCQTRTSKCLALYWVPGSTLAQLHTPSSRPLLEALSWCFEPSQPQRITSGLETNFSLSPSYSLNKL